MTLEVRSSAFDPNGEIPELHTCEGRDASPALEWSGAPPATRSFALIVDDPDAPDPRRPTHTFVHWVLYDIPAATTGIDEGAAAPSGAREGVNGSNDVGYTGPCPPRGRHRYVFKLYALDVLLGDLGRPKKADVEAAMRGHVLASAEVIGTYERARAERR